MGRRARIEERTSPVNMRMAKDMLYLHLRLIQSALGQKAEAKLLGFSQWESRQERAAMGVREVACLPAQMGPPLGRSQERASPFLAKFDQSASFATGRAAAHAVSGVLLALVTHATTSDIWFVRSTDEVPRRPLFRTGVSFSYKSYTKGRSDASETGTDSPRPRLKGCQQRQSRGIRGGLALLRCLERLNLRVPLGPLRSTGPVSPVSTATRWPGRTSSCQPTGPLSNSPPLIPEPGRVAVRPR